MMCSDVNRAYFYGISLRRVFTTLLPGHEEGYGALLFKTMYGTEDAAAVWQDMWTEHVKEIGIQMGSASSALFVGPELRGFCHGDNFLLVAATRVGGVCVALVDEIRDTKDRAHRLRRRVRDGNDEIVLEAIPDM